MIDTVNQLPSSSKLSEACSQSSSCINSSISDKESASSQTEIHTNTTYTSPKTVQSITQFPNSNAKPYTSKFTPEIKTKADNSVQAISKGQPTLPKTLCSSPANSQQTLSLDSNPQTMTLKGPSRNEPKNNIDLSSLSAVLDDGENKDEKSVVVLNDTSDENSKSNIDQNPQNTSN